MSQPEDGGLYDNRTVPKSYKIANLTISKIDYVRCVVCGLRDHIYLIENEASYICTKCEFAFKPSPVYISMDIMHKFLLEHNKDANLNQSGGDKLTTANISTQPEAPRALSTTNNQEEAKET